MSAHASNKTYWLIALILAVITALEVAYPFVTEGITALTYYYMPILAVMSAMKFFLVVAFFMHLKFDTLLLTWILMFSLVLACGLATAMLVLFSVIKWW